MIRYARIRLDDEEDLPAEHYTFRRSCIRSTGGLECRRSGLNEACIIVVPARGLNKTQTGRKAGSQRTNVPASENRSNDEYKEQDEHCKVRNGEADNSSLTKLRLLQRVNRSSDLTATLTVSGGS